MKALSVPGLQSRVPSTLAAGVSITIVVRRTPASRNPARLSEEKKEKKMAAGIDNDFLAASEHGFTCRCPRCLKWWVKMGPDGGVPDDYGPFSTEEVKQAAEELGLPFYKGDPENA